MKRRSLLKDTFFDVYVQTWHSVDWSVVRTVQGVGTPGFGLQVWIERKAAISTLSPKERGFG